mmetsp:Transcript_19224/g.55149  ORF Transcript_19224/g.55149 Transcript_19224/m.55149 type:complete len:233 (-) Transcript_19224:754-1452(-)
MTMEHVTANAKNRCFNDSSRKMCSSAGPVTIMALSLGNWRRTSSASAWSRACRMEFPSASGGLSSAEIVMPLSKTFELNPMLRAVSNLSPVSTHRLMPAFLKLTIVSGTPSCNLSSIAVAPARSRFTSISSATLASSAARSPRDLAALSNVFFHSTNSSFFNDLRPITSVRRPCSANSCSAFCIMRLSWPLSARSSITLSAPFTSKLNSPLNSTTTDWRFRVESNAFTACTV